MCLKGRSGTQKIVEVKVPGSHFKYMLLKKKSIYVKGEGAEESQRVMKVHKESRREREVL